ncbi:Puromycin resistance protein pur8 [Streptomyces avermitilis]|uniref:Transmembrane efflux protein n=2 Tax=Streptomyces avermitilis TaxID=33903 RepID=Q825G7_STRAW|nr:MULTISPECIES: MFS transporter [Streptomyces]KUN50076.1 Puromycin resistance protein pur8 [Streptomyces avermitilis]MYT03027.1 DHA2 family efflux MFS transporter permease subunit [Streptomyces sp. SID5469]OOV26163.1 MFS transporter [Streptomyces avermitilis]BAC75201.1 putative transmembrane efflux protein [Streptomyces avermitilis MA-4680 = NBRC 14893]BBJ55855.1 MFS transporter [Streptomyces avermitilis]
MSQKTLTESTRTGAAQAPPAASSRRWWILAVVAIAQLMVVLDATIVNIALPSAQADLGFSDGNRQWVVTAYALAFASLLLLGGRIADLFGRKPAFLAGVTGFALASALGGAATSFEMLVTARALQGVFGALLAPAALSLLNTTFTDARERAKAFSVYGAIAGAGGAVGLLLGGILTDAFDWRWTLYVNVAIAVVAFAGGWLSLSNHRDATNSKLDVPGTVLVAGGLFALVYGFSNAETHDWGSPRTWGFLIAGGVLLTAFAWWQTRAAHPLLPLRILLDRSRGASYLAVLITGAGMFGVFLFLTYYLQLNLGFSPTRTGVAFLPMVGALMVTAQLGTTVLLPRIGPKAVIPLGFAIATVGMAWLTGIGTGSHYATAVLPQLIVIGVGLGMVMPPAMQLATGGVGPEDAGVASATVNAMQQVGGSIGTALLNTLAASAATGYLSGKDATSKLVRAQATIESYTTAFWWSAVFFVAGAVIAFLLYRPGKPEQAADAAPVVHM